MNGDSAAAGSGEAFKAAGVPDLSKLTNAEVVSLLQYHALASYTPVETPTKPTNSHGHHFLSLRRPLLLHHHHHHHQATANQAPPPHHPTHKTTRQPSHTTALAAAILTTAPPSLAEFKLYYGTAASAANYGGYGRNSDKKAKAKYTYEVPGGWKEKLFVEDAEGDDTHGEIGERRVEKGEEKNNKKKLIF